MIKSRFFHALVAIAVLVAVPACDSDSVTDDPFLGEVTRVEDVPADPATGRDPVTGQPVGTTGHFTLFSLANNAIVTSGANFSAADSNSTNWDIGFRGTTIIVNGGTSGPGQGGAIVREGIFEDLEDAPTSGYDVDTAQGYAVPTGSGNGWYNYNPAAMVLAPIPGRFLVIRTADGKYAKARILSYYQGAPDPVDPFSDQERYYTFEFVYQPDGSTQLVGD